MLPQTSSRNITTDEEFNMTKGLMVVLAIMILWIGISAVIFTWRECGAKTLLLGNGGFYAAAMEMCK